MVETFGGIAVATEIEQLQLLIGQKLEWAGLFPGHRMLLLKFPTLLLEVQENDSIIAGCSAALTMRFCVPRPGHDFIDVRLLLEETPHCVELRGLPFEGLDGDVLTFGPDKGVRVSRGGIDFVRLLES